MLGFMQRRKHLQLRRNKCLSSGMREKGEHMCPSNCCVCKSIHISVHYMKWRGAEESLRCSDPGISCPNWWSYLQWAAAERLKSCVQSWNCSTIVSQPDPLVSTSLSLTPSDCLSTTLSSLCLSRTSSHCLSSVPGSPLLFFREGNHQTERAIWMRCCHMWIMTQQSYIIRPFLLSSPFPTLTQQLTHQHAPQQQMEIPDLDGPACPHPRWRVWLKAEAIFTRSEL